MTQAKLSQNPLTHNHRQTSRTGYRSITAQISCTPSTAPANTTARGQPGHSRLPHQAGLPGSMAVPLVLCPRHEAVSSPTSGAVRAADTQPPGPAPPGCAAACPRCRQRGPGCQGLLLRASEMTCASTRNAQNEKNVVPSSIGILSSDINTTKDTSPPDFAAEHVCVRLQKSRESHSCYSQNITAPFPKGISLSSLFSATSVSLPL